MVENYGCELNRGLSVVDYIHKGCCHVESEAVARLADIRRRAVGDPAMYRKHSYITVNGLPPTSGGKRTEERRVGQECRCTCRYRWSQYPKQNKKHTNQ